MNLRSVGLSLRINKLSNMSALDFSLIIPCYNEGSTLLDSVNKILNELNRLKLSWEIIFVEDKSTDNTREILEKIAKRIKNSKIIYHSKNQGRGKSVSDGIRLSKAEMCGFLDVDCEVSPSYIPLFVKEIEDGSDLAVGKRFYEKGLKSMQRVIASRIYASLVKWILKIPIDDTEAGYKFFNRKKVQGILSKVKSKGWFWDTEICAIAHYDGFKIAQIPVIFSRRIDKKSTVRLFADSIDYLKQLYRFKSRTLGI